MDAWVRTFRWSLRWAWFALTRACLPGPRPARAPACPTGPGGTDARAPGLGRGGDVYGREGIPAYRSMALRSGARDLAYG